MCMTRKLVLMSEHHGKEYFLNRVAMEIHNLEINIQKMGVKLPVFLFSALMWRILRVTMKRPL